jgi:hypothetical protein
LQIHPSPAQLETGLTVGFAATLISEERRSLWEITRFLSNS